MLVAILFCVGHRAPIFLTLDDNVGPFVSVVFWRAAAAVILEQKKSFLVLIVILFRSTECQPFFVNSDESVFGQQSYAASVNVLLPLIFAVTLKAFFLFGGLCVLCAAAVNFTFGD